MRSYLKALVVGGLLSLPFLGFGAGFIVMGVEATVHGWASLDKPKYDWSGPSRRTNDITRLYGPGAILGGASLCVGGLLVIPSGVIAEWKQVITGLNEEGNRLLAGLTDEAYRQKMSVLERLLNHYLTTGKMLRGGV